VKFDQVSDQAAEQLKNLADRVHLILVSAGIPAFDTSNPSPDGGAEIDVDSGDDEAGGVYISWKFSRDLTAEISQHVLNKEYSHPRIQYSGQIRLAMRAAIIAILNSAGLSAEPAEDDIRALAVRVSD